MPETPPINIENIYNALRTAAKKYSKKEEVINWKNRERWWKDNIEKLYKNISKWCEPVKEINISKYKISIQENNIGTYETEKLELSIGGATFFFIPVATNIAGGKGRIDILYNNSKNFLILNDNSEWYLTDHSRNNIEILTKDTFLIFLKNKIGI